MNKTTLWTMGGVALACALVACGGGETDNSPRNIDIQFAAVAGAQAVDCSSNLTNLGTGNAAGGLKDMRFYISDVKLVRADGVDVPLTLGANSNWNVTQGNSAVTLIDLENNTGTCAGTGTAATNTGIQGTVPAGNYVGVKMTLGVPFALNHTDQGADVSVTPAVVNNAVHPGMAWAWAGGRKFAKIEVTNAAWTAPTFNVHLGSTGCTGTNPSAGQVDSCSRPNRLNFAFASFDPTTQKIAVDVQALLAANDVTVNTPSTAAGCMSASNDPECTGVFGKLGIDLATGLTQSNNSQALFRVIAR